MVNLHLDSFPVARQPAAQPAQPVDVDELRADFAADADLPALECEVQAFGAPPTAPPADAVDHDAVVAKHRKRVLREVPLVRLAERRSAKQEALVAAQAEIAEEEQKRAEAVAAEQERLDRLWTEVESVRADVERKTEEAAEQERKQRVDRQREEQAELDRQWARLEGNDPEVVQRHLGKALTDWARGRVGEVLSVVAEGSEVLVTVLVDQPEQVVPDERAEVTPAGRATTKKRTQTDRNQLYFSTLASGVLGLANCAFATAPGLDGVSALVVRQEVKGRKAGDVAAIYFGRFRREDPALASEDPADAAELAASARVNIKGRTDEVAPLDLLEEPHLQRALDRARQTLGTAARN